MLALAQFAFFLTSLLESLSVLHEFLPLLHERDARAYIYFMVRTTRKRARPLLIWS
jgi:hypothetical protein